MSEKRFEDDGECVCCSYDYSLLDTYYELKGERIIEWNKHSSNAEYFDFEGIVELLNIKQMRLESRKKYDKSLSETMLERDKVIKENNQLKDDAKIVLLILNAIGELPFKISVNEAKAIKRLSENVGELFDGDE